MKRHVVAALVALMGAAMVFGLLVTMNAFSQPPKQDKAKESVQFQAPPKQKKKKKKKQARRQKPKSKPRSNTPPPPAPNLASNLGGIGFDLPGISAGNVADVSDKLIGDVKASVMTEDSVDDKPQPRRRTAASYPPRARAEGITGYVVMNLLINENGMVERVKVLEAKPTGVFEEAARETVQSWQFDPATYQGEAVKVWARQTIRFDLS